MSDKKRPIKSKKTKKKNKRGAASWIKKIIVFALCFFLIFPIVTFTTLSIYYSFQEKEMNVLVFGTDGTQSRTEDGYYNNDNPNADFLKVFQIDTFPNDVNVYTIPRDTMVYISCPEDNLEGTYKVNQSFTYGSTECLVKTVGELLDLEMTGYIGFDIMGAIGFIDDIGGVEVTSTGTFCEQDSQANPDAYCFEEGVTYQMDGEMAVAYGRHRKSDDDYERGKRQLQVVQGVINQLIYLGLHGHFKQIESAIMDNFNTNMSFNQILLFGANIVIEELSFWNGKPAVYEIREPITQPYKGEKLN